MRAIVTGGAGFIGSALCRRLVAEAGWEVLNLDLLTYAANLESLAPIEGRPNYRFVQGDICDAPRVASLIADFAPNAILHLAAESHVDRSIDGPGMFVRTNIVGTHVLLDAALAYWRALPDDRKERFRFLHVSTDEVFGSLPAIGAFSETTPYDPRSPYSASKAASDHLARAYAHTYGLPVLVSNCSNNYGPYHFPEKLIPLMILNALEGRPLPVYGDGLYVRDWLFVDDHAAALQLIVEKGAPGQTYCIGGRNERTNLDVVHRICDLLDERVGLLSSGARRGLVTHVKDRPGHDRRYAIDASKLEAELGWRATQDFDSGISRTVDWYLANRDWWEPIRRAKYAGERLGAG